MAQPNTGKTSAPRPSQSQSDTQEPISRQRGGQNVQKHHVIIASSERSNERETNAARSQTEPSLANGAGYVKDHKEQHDSGRKAKSKASGPTALENNARQPWHAGETASVTRTREKQNIPGSYLEKSVDRGEGHEEQRSTHKGKSYDPRGTTDSRSNVIQQWDDGGKGNGERPGKQGHRERLKSRKPGRQAPSREPQLGHSVDRGEHHHGRQYREKSETRATHGGRVSRTDPEHPWHGGDRNDSDGSTH